MKKDFFPVAVWYGENKARAPMMPRADGTDTVRTRRDLQNIRDLGFNSVRYWVDWATCEPERGKYDFGQVLKFLDLADEYELMVIIQIYLDSAPNWLAELYPDGFYTSQTGHSVESQASPGYSLDHPEIRENAAGFMKGLARSVREKPAFYGWDVWSEPHIVNWSWFDYMGAAPWFDYNPHARERFVSWLRKMYGSIERLNEKWYRTYRSWDDVRIPKYVTLSTFKDLMDWQRFNLEKLREDLQWRTDCVKSEAPDHVATSHSAISSLYSSPIRGGGSPDDWKMAKAVDVWGTSFYPKHVGWLMPLDYALKGFALDATRCSSHAAGKDFWIGELQTGHGVTGMHFGEPVDEKDVVQWAWISISRGAKGLCYYAYYPMSCGYEISGFGLVHPDGDLTPRSKTAGTVGKIVTENRKMFLDAKPVKSRVAIVYNIDSYMMLSALREEGNELIRSSLLGLYRMLTEENIQADFVHVSEIRDGKLSDYRIVFAPVSIMLDSETAGSIGDYVRNGGVFVSEFRPGWSDMDGNCETKIPGMGLDEVFGCHEIWWREVKNTEIKMNSDFQKDLASVTGSGYEEAFEVTGGKAVGRFRDGSAAVVINEFGKGKAIVAGSMLSREYEKSRDKKVKDFFAGILKMAGVSSPVSAENGTVFVEARTMKIEDGYLLFIFNHDPSEEARSKILFREIEGEYDAFDVAKNEKIECERKENGISIDVKLKSSEVLVVKLAAR